MQKQCIAFNCIYAIFFKILGSGISVYNCEFCFYKMCYIIKLEYCFNIVINLTQEQGCGLC